MKRKALLIVALVAILVAVACLVVLLLGYFGVLPQDSIEERMFVSGYAFLPVPLVGFLAGVLLQIFSIRSRKRKNDRE